MAAPYIPEEQTADWTSQAIRAFFREAGFSCSTYKVTQHLERDLPADRMFLDPGTWKVFGLQYKTLYHNGEDRWPIYESQHKTMEQFPWIYYCCSELTEPGEAATALHQARFYRGSFQYLPALLYKERRTPRYYSWGELYQGIKRCTFGAQLWSKKEFSELLNRLEGEARLLQARQMYEVFVVEVRRRKFVAPAELPSGEAVG